MAVRGSRTVLHAYGPAAGPAVLAVHGFRGTHYGLEPLARALGAAGFRVTVPDLPGAGHSTQLRGRLDTAELGAWLRELGNLLPTSPVLVGHSYGTVIVGAAISAGVRHAGVVLLNPILRAPLTSTHVLGTAATRLYYALAGRLPERIASRLLSDPVIAAIGSELMTGTDDQALRTWIRGQHLRHAGAFSSPAAVLESYAAATADTVTDYAPPRLGPSLLLGGDRDRLGASAAQLAEAAARFGGSSHVFANRGHLLPYEEVPGVTRLVTEWYLSRDGTPNGASAAGAG